MMKLVLFPVVIILSCSLFSCQGDVKKSQSANDNKKTTMKFYPNLGDSFMYVGTTRLRSTLDNYDTSYNDTIKIFRLTNDSFTLRINKLEYKKFSDFPLNELGNYTIDHYKNTFSFSNNNAYDDKYECEYFKSVTTFLFRTSDSLYFFDEMLVYSRKKKDQLFFIGKNINNIQ